MRKILFRFRFGIWRIFVVVVILERKYALKSTFARDVPIKKVYCDKKKDSNQKWTNRKRRKIDKNNLKDVKLPIIAWNCCFFVCVYVIWFAFIAVVCCLHVRGILLSVCIYNTDKCLVIVYQCCFFFLLCVNSFRNRPYCYLFILLHIVTVSNCNFFFFYPSVLVEVEAVYTQSLRSKTHIPLHLAHLER